MVIPQNYYILAYGITIWRFTYVRAVWLDQFWRNYCPFWQRLFHYEVLMWHSSYVSNLNSLKLSMLSYNYKYIRIHISVLLVDRTIFEGVIVLFIKKYWGWGRYSCFCVTILITFVGINFSQVKMKLNEKNFWGMECT